MAQHRSVRFMPMAHGANPPPVFSPTQVETKTSVLHSVFSPTLQQQRRAPSDADRATDAAFRAQLSKSIDYSLGDGLETNNPLAPSDRRFTSKVGANNRAFPGGAVISTARSPSPRRPGGIRHVGGEGLSIDNISPLSTTTSDVFFSPQASFAGLTSPKSVLSGTTHKTSGSFKSLRDVTLLDVDNINKCESVDDLENVIQVLDGEGRFQALLRKARSRLATILGEGASKGQPPNRYLVDKPYIAPKTQPFFLPEKKEPEPKRDAEVESTPNYSTTNQPVFQQHQAAQVKPPPPQVPPSPPTQDYSTTNQPVFQPQQAAQFKPPPPPPSTQVPPPAKKMASPPKFSNFVSREAPKPAANTISSVNYHYAIQLEPEANLPRNDFAPQGARAGVPLESATDLNDTNESSLVMSLSSSMLDANFDEYAPMSSKKSPSFTMETRRLSGRQSPSIGYDKTLSDELKRLTETVLNMETARAADRKLFLEKLMSLDTQPHRAGGQDFKTIEGMMKQSTTSTRKLLDSLEQLRSESRELQDSVKQERQSWNRTYEEAQQLEKRLCQKAEELTERLTSGPLANNEASVTKAQEMRAQYEAEIAEKDRENEQLANNLRDTLEGLLVSLGRNKNELQSMTRGEQKELVSSFAMKQLSSSAAMEAMAREVASLEKERRDASRATEAVSSQLEKSKRAQLQLERENKQLCEKIQTLSEELSEMRIYMQELSTNRDTEQDRKYQEIIRTLKAQLRKEETSKCLSFVISLVMSAVVVPFKIFLTL